MTLYQRNLAPGPRSERPSLSTAAGRRRGLYRAGGKRVLDIALVLAAAPFVVPVLLVLLVLAARDGGKPLFRQQRVGRGGRVYDMLKIRSMVPDAEGQLAEYLATDPVAHAEWDRTQKLRHDPRITRFGRFLRKTSLDEVPQLWNVLRGDMSLVGPRPMLPAQEALYPGQAYYALRPGITGPWQVLGRNDTTFAARASYDTRYDETLSLWGDLRLLWRTVAAVLGGTGY